MGQMYDVSICLKFNDRERLSDKLDEFYKTIPNATEHAFEAGDIFNRLRMLTCCHQETDIGYHENKSRVRFATWFHASYSWEMVLWNLLDVLAPVLEDGSSMQVYPDEGRWMRSIQDGVVIDGPCVTGDEQIPGSE